MVTAEHRPRQVTVAGWCVIVGGLLLIATAYDGLVGLRSIGTHATLARTLGTSAGQVLSVGEAQALIHVALVLAAVCAAATVVLGVFVLQRHRRARLVLACLLVPVIVTAPLTDVFPAALLVGVTTLLWGRPACTWFADPAAQVPGVVRAAALVTTLLCGATALVYLVVLVVLLTDSGSVAHRLADNPSAVRAGLGADDVRVLGSVTAVVLMGWCGGAIALARMTLRRRTWARWALVGSAGVSGMLGSLALPMSTLQVVGAGLALGLLLSPTSAAWFSRRPPGPPSGSSGGPPPGQWRLGASPPLPPGSDHWPSPSGPSGDGSPGEERPKQTASGHPPLP